MHDCRTQMTPVQIVGFRVLPEKLRMWQRRDKITLQNLEGVLEIMTISQYSLC